MSKKNNLTYVPASAKTAAQKQDEAKQQRRRRSSANLSPEARKKLLKKRVWTLSVITLSMILVLTLSLIFATYEPTLYSEKTNTAPTEDADSNLIKNQEFSLSKLLYNGLLSSAVSYPYLPDNWTLSDSSNANNSVSGVVSLGSDDTDRVTNGLKSMGLTDAQISDILNTDGFDNTQSDGSSDETETKDNSVMLFYNKTESNSMVTSNSFTVPTGGYLEITVRIRTSITQGDGAFIALGTTSTYSSDSATVQFTGVDTDGAWKEYKIYVEGNKTSTRTVYLFIGLGTSSSPVSGWAEVDYATAVSAKKVDYLGAAENSGDVKTHTFVQNASEDSVDIGSMIASGSVSAMTAEEITGDANLAELPFETSADRVIYKVSNASDSESDNSYMMKFGERFHITQSTATPYYRFSFWAKTADITNNNTGAYFYAVIYEVSADGEPVLSYTKSFDLVKTSTDEDDVNSGWAEYTFLLQPDNTKDYYVEFVFSLGELRYVGNGGYQHVTPDVGYEPYGNLYLTEFEMQEIYQSEYSSASEGDAVKKVSVSGSASTGLITNGSFDSPVSNAYSQNSAGVPVGYDPNGWSISFPRHMTDSGYVYTPHSATDVLFGILAKNADESDKQRYLGSDYADYFGHTGDDNILAVNVKNPTAVGFVSNKFTLSANSYYIISFMVKASDYSNIHAYLSGDIEQAFDIKDLTDDEYFVVNEYENGGYLKYNFIVKTGDSSKSVALELWVGDRDASYDETSWTGLAASGTVVAFDEAKTQTIDETKFNEIVGSQDDAGNDVFTKEETKGQDENGKEITTDVTYTTEKENVWVRDYSYVDTTSSSTDSGDSGSGDTTQPLEPINWLLLSSLILGVAVIIFLVTMIVKKFRFVKKTNEIPDDPDYKK